MPIEPREVWRNLLETLRQAIAEDLGQVMREMAVWLLTGIDPDEPDYAWGLIDFGIQSPELGPVEFADLESMVGPDELSIGCDPHFTADKTLSEYAEEAFRLKSIKA